MCVIIPNVDYDQEVLEYREEEKRQQVACCSLAMRRFLCHMLPHTLHPPACSMQITRLVTAQGRMHVYLRGSDTGSLLQLLTAV